MITSVRDRLYRGPCRRQEQVDPYVANFIAKKDELLALPDSIPGLDKESREGHQGLPRRLLFGDQDDEGRAEAIRRVRGQGDDVGADRRSPLRRPLALHPGAHARGFRSDWPATSTVTV